MKVVKTFGQYLDQPILVGKFEKAVPSVLTGIAVLHCAKEVHDAPKNKREKAFVYSSTIMTATVLSSLIAPKIAAKIVGKEYEKININKIQKQNKILIENYNKNNIHSEQTQKILSIADKKVLSIKQIFMLRKELLKTKNGEKFLKNLIPEPENITSKEIVKDMGRLSIMGAIPVAGGILGGVTADKITDKDNWKTKFPDKIKEGIYQYLANIFLCNVGAASALGIMESMNVKSKSIRALSMVGGIIITGVVGGSLIANYISKKIVTPVLDKKFHNNRNFSGGYKERKPEPLDICLHADDIATIAVMSGFKWIEPALPILYAISGYRAAIGYRGKE